MRPGYPGKAQLVVCVETYPWGTIGRNGEKASKAPNQHAQAVNRSLFTQDSGSYLGVPQLDCGCMQHVVERYYADQPSRFLGHHVLQSHSGLRHEVSVEIRRLHTVDVVSVPHPAGS
jgi:hypothetical protein